MTSLFQGMPEAELQVLLERMPRCRFPAGAIAVAEGDRPPGVYVIRSGSADAGGTRLARGSTFGEDGVIPGAAARATVRALEELETIQVRRRDLDLIAYSFPEVASRLGGSPLGDQPGRIVLLEERDAPPLAAHDLAAEVSRHSGRRALLIVVADQFAPELERLAVSTDDLLAGGLRSEPGVDVLLQRPEGAFAAENLGATVGGLATACEHVLLSAPTLPDLKGVRRLVLGEDAPAGAQLGRLARELAGLRVGIAAKEPSGLLAALGRLGVDPDFVAETAAACAEQGADVVLALSSRHEPPVDVTVVTLDGTDLEPALPRLAAALPWLRTA
jgi:CRP-like cAMP-binding protein